MNEWRRKIDEKLAKSPWGEYLAGLEDVDPEGWAEHVEEILDSLDSLQEDTMVTNDIKKGTRIQLRCGWYATVVDNKRGNTRMAKVEGFVTEVGSVYSHDIMRALIDDRWVTVEHTPAQDKLRERVERMGF